MRYAPYPQEYEMAKSMTERQTLDYFLTRIFESEEVWGLENGVEWTTVGEAEAKALPLWPYKTLAEDFVSPKIEGLLPDAMALEDFVADFLPSLAGENLLLQIMPSPQRAGSYIAPETLLSILEGMMEAGEYKLDA